MNSVIRFFIGFIQGQCHFRINKITVKITKHPNRINLQQNSGHIFLEDVFELKIGAEFGGQRLTTSRPRQFQLKPLFPTVSQWAWVIGILTRCAVKFKFHDLYGGNDVKKRWEV